MGFLSSTVVFRGDSAQKDPAFKKFEFYLCQPISSCYFRYRENSIDILEKFWQFQLRIRNT
jgi:hypothetical protein